METIQIGLDKKLIRATDETARRRGLSRSAFVREALREHIRRLDVQTSEEREREGYLRRPQQKDEYLSWEGEAVWPAD